MQYYTALLQMAKKRGMTTMVYANGIGPIRREKNRSLAKKTLLRCDKISVRDPDSYRMLLDMGIGEDKVRLSADPAFLLELPPEEVRRKTLARLGVSDLASGSYVVVSLRRLNRKRDREADGKLAKECAALCSHLYREKGLTTVFVPLQPQNDAEICTCACTALQEACGEGACRMLQPETATELLTVLTGARLTIAMRLHCLIYAVAAGVPLIGLSYDPKIDALLHSLHQPYSYDAAHIQADTLYAAVEEILQNEEGIRADLSQAAITMRERCQADVAEAARILALRQKNHQ